MLQPGRTYNAQSPYPYSFNGKRDDKDADIGYQDYGMREYDRLRGQFISVDPVTAKYPELTPYQFASNSPVKFTDLDGAEKYDPSHTPTGVTYISLATVPANPVDARTDYSIKAGPYRLYPVPDPSGDTKGYWVARLDFNDGPYQGTHRDDWVVGTNGVSQFVGNADSYYHKANFIDKYGIDNSPAADQMANGWGKIVSDPMSWIVGATTYFGGIGSANYEASVGQSIGNDYRSTFLNAHPEIDPNAVVVHHAIEQQVLTRYPGVFTESEINSLENLRGIPKDVNSELHLSTIRKEWNAFYRNNPNATRQQILDQATAIDKQYGAQFNPSTGNSTGTTAPPPPVNPQNTQDKQP